MSLLRWAQGSNAARSADGRAKYGNFPGLQRFPFNLNQSEPWSPGFGDPEIKALRHKNRGGRDKPQNLLQIASE
jgi:hypothetical protein